MWVVCFGVEAEVWEWVECGVAGKIISCLQWVGEEAIAGDGGL